ncbi:twitching motility protein PilT [Shinella sp. SUS2]|uniref:type II toxin-antitoxin system VapC family toxin n=1 Tax=unclassified Shinella TaxID=2643062 RepID=UPI000682310E|nr:MULTISPECIES: type II toxin-antitoxin system VapC family toxin [unclassified Shinella]KNY15787.1 twitching motility protein PilT [Shinella sp. SUS2]KOC75818.1 twitching motility protein PilT [Shinella sp. GWS1]
MFLDASAIVAMMTNESDAESLSARLAAARSPTTSAMALWEASVAYSRIFRLEPNTALREVEAYIRLFDVQIIAIEPAIAAAAVDAYHRFGKGRHPAGLNFGDCFAYACARQLGMPLLHKDDDLPQTDIETA